MKRGPKPVGAAVRLVRGSRRRPRHTPEESRPAAAGAVARGPGAVGSAAVLPPRGPRWLTRAQKRVWVQELVPRQLAAWQAVQAARYCQVRVRWEAAVQVVSREGEVLETGTGYKYVHPLVKVVKDLGKELQEVAQQLGLEREEPAAAAPGVVAGRTKQRFFGR